MWIKWALDQNWGCAIIKTNFPKILKMQQTLAVLYNRWWWACACFVAPSSDKTRGTDSRQANMDGPIPSHPFFAVTYAQVRGDSVDAPAICWELWNANETSLRTKVSNGYYDVNQNFKINLCSIQNARTLQTNLKFSSKSSLKCKHKQLDLYL